MMTLSRYAQRHSLQASILQKLSQPVIKATTGNCTACVQRTLPP